MPILLIALAIVAAVVARDTAIDTFALVNAVMAFVANGVCANFSRAEADDVPNWAAGLAFITLLASIAFLVVGIAS